MNVSMGFEGSREVKEEKLSRDGVVMDVMEGVGEGKRDARRENEEHVEGATEGKRPDVQLHASKDSSPVASLRREETLPLLALALAAVLDLLATRILFLDPFSSSSSSFFGGMFSLPLPTGRRPPRGSGSSSSPLPRLGPLPPATADLSWAGETRLGVLCVLVNVPPRPVGVAINDTGEGRPVLPVPMDESELAFRRVEGRNMELDRVRGGFIVGVVADERVKMGRVGVVNVVGAVDVDDAVVRLRVGVEVGVDTSRGVEASSASSCVEVARVRFVGPGMSMVDTRCRMHKILE